MTKTYNACTLKKKKDEFKWYDGSAYKTKNFNGKAWQQESGVKVSD